MTRLLPNFIYKRFAGHPKPSAGDRVLWRPGTDQRWLLMSDGRKYPLPL